MEQTLSSYYIFYIVAQCQNISKAAAKLYISQPAVSNSIKKLENCLGCQLFVRSSRGVTLTEEGCLLYQHVKTAMDTLAVGEKKVRHAAGLGIGHLKIGVSSTLCRYVLLGYLKNFTKQYPQINISITCQSTSETLHLLQEDQLDIGLVGLGTAELSRALTFDYLMDIQDMFAASEQYLDHLQQRGIAKDAVLENCSLMMLDKHNISRQFIDEYLQKHKITVQECIEASSMDLLIEFAKISLGVACVIRQFVAPELSDGTLVEIPLPAPIAKRSVGFVYKPQRNASRPMKQFIDFYSAASSCSFV